MPTPEPAVQRRSRVREKRSFGEGPRLAVTVLVLALAAWVWLVLGPDSHAGSGHGIPDLGGMLADHAPAHHDGAHASAIEDHMHVGVRDDAAGGVAAWYTGWLVMVLAMMLPPALPLLRVSARLARALPHPRTHVAACAGAFLVVWALAGIGLLLLASLTGYLFASWQWLQEQPTAAAGMAALLAAGYQLTPLKQTCLSSCRSPVGLAMTTWTGTRSTVVEAGRLGVRYGLVCVGCCWALMLLTVVASVAALPVMVVAAVLMAAERLVPRVRPLVPAIAILALAYGVMLLVLPFLEPGAT